MLLHTGDTHPTARTLVTLRNKVGLHSRPAGALVRVAKKFRAQITLTRADKEADAQSLPSLLGLEAGQGAFVEIVAIGEDAHQAIEALRALVLDKFGEPE